MAFALQTAATVETSGLCPSSGAPWDLTAWQPPWRQSKTEVDVLSCLRLMVFNRLCDPGSKLGVLRWLETVALPVDSGVVCEHQHLLRAMDVLVEHSDKLNSKLATLMRPLIDQDLSVVFYDLTTVAVLGQTNSMMMCVPTAWPNLRKLRQFMLSLVQTAEGLPIAHEVPRQHSRGQNPAALDSGAYWLATHSNVWC